jgi:moderate conductance mechanosensitive channel
MLTTPMALPTLDILLHNLVALGVVVVVLMLLSQIIMAPLLAVLDRLLRSSLFSELTTEDRAAFRRRLRRGALVVVALLSAVLLIGSLVASFTGVRALDVVKAALMRLREQDLLPLGARLPKAVGIALSALIVDALVRAVAGGLGKALAGSTRFSAHSEPLTRAITHLRTALRTAILCGAAVLIADTLGLPAGAQRAVTLVSYVLVAFYASRLIVAVGHLAVDLLFDMSGKLSRLESPLKYLGSLTHLAGITKRAVDYFVYVGTATWIADELTPNTWPAHAGRVGIRIIAIFYASRVVVEVCLLFVNELFLSNATGRSETELQQRKTLVPVAMGLLRYGIYFSALVMVLREADIDPTPLLAGAGVLGVAVGLGAQAFVGDIVAGFFILFENLLLVGDLVEVSGVRGKVEEIGVRITKIRDGAGVLHAIPNGEVRKVSSHSKAYVNAMVDVHVPYDEDLRRVRPLLTSIAERALEAETGKRGTVEVTVQELAEGSVLFRVIARVPPGKDDDIGDELRARILEELRDAGIGAPRARRAILIDGAELRVAAPSERREVEESKGPPKPFQPPGAAD